MGGSPPPRHSMSALAVSISSASSSPPPPPSSSSSSHPPLPRSSPFSHPPLPPSSSSAPRSSGSPTLTSPPGLSSSSLLNTEIVTEVQLAVLLAVFFFVPFCLLTEQRRRSERYHRDPPNLREDDLYGQTPRYLPYFPDFKMFNFFGIIDVNIQTPPSCRFHLGNPPGVPPSPHVSMPHPPTSQPLNIGVDPSSGLSASQQSLPTRPPVPVPHPPTSQPVLNSAVDSSSGFPASQQRLALPSPVSVPRPPTSQAVLNNGVDSNSGFPASQRPLPLPSPVSMPRPTTSQPVLNNGADSSFGFPASQQSLPPLRPVSVSLPPTSQPVLNNGVDSSSGFLASQQPLPTSPPVFVPCPPTSQPLNSGVDSCSGFLASQQPLPTPPPQSMSHPPTSQPVLNSGVDSSSCLRASRQPLPLPSPVSVPCPLTPKPVLNNEVDSSSGFSTSQYPSASPPKKITVEISEATRDLYKGILPGNKNMLLKIGGSQGEREFQQPLPPPSPGISLGISKKFTYEELVLATDSFSETNLLGQGGFGYVYKGILSGNKHIAVKKLKVGGSQGELEFQAEVEIISHLHHRHLVSLEGYCIAGSQRLLVYEFVPNNTLAHHLHAEGQPSMEWPTRLKIARGVARGLAYLHEDCYPKIIHRDIKASNILLDSNFEAKLADFGLAKLLSEGSPHIKTVVKGTPGYCAPEYLLSGELTDKSDVFSFGVVLLELITGRRPLDSTLPFPQSRLVFSAQPLLARAMEDGNLDALVDPCLQNNYNVNDMLQVVACAAICVQDSARNRPPMERIVRVLEGDVHGGILRQEVSLGGSDFVIV